MGEKDASYDSDEQTRIMARLFSDAPGFLQAFQSFAYGEPGHSYASQFYKATEAMNSIEGVARQAIDDQLFKHIETLKMSILQCISEIPVPIDSTIHQAHTPFSTYCFVKSITSTAGIRVVWMDRYFDGALFSRYFVDTAPKAMVTLVTYPESKCTSAKDRRRYADFMSVSKLFAQERGSSGYSLVTDEHFHDRWLRCDDKLFSLGGSIKDLGKDTTFTISKIDSEPSNIFQFEEPIKRGTEVFGPNQPTHP